MPRTPLALFVYNRPRHAQRALAALSRCADLDRCRLIIYCDAPKRPAHAEGVAATAKVVASWAARLGAEVVISDVNQGIAKSIFGAVSDLVERDGRVIVLEDDLVPAPEFLSFMLAGLDRYAGAEEVAQISGCLLTGSEPSQLDGFFLPLTTTWGWATWARAWRLFDLDASIDSKLADSDPAFRARFTLDGTLGSESTIDYLRMLSDRVNGKNDSWGILWWFAVARAEKLVLYPRESLIWNGGFDGSGVHSGGLLEFQAEAPIEFRAARLSGALTFPETVTVNVNALTSLRQHLRATSASPKCIVRLRRLAGRLATRLIRPMIRWTHRP